MSGVAPGPTSGYGSSRSRVNRGNGLAGPRVAARTVTAVRRTVAAEEGVATTASVPPLARDRRERVLHRHGRPVALTTGTIASGRMPTTTSPSAFRPVVATGPLVCISDFSRLAPHHPRSVQCSARAILAQ